MVVLLRGGGVGIGIDNSIGVSYGIGIDNGFGITVDNGIGVDYMVPT